MAEMTTRSRIERRPIAANEASLEPVLQIDNAGAFEIIVPYTSPKVTAQVVERAAALSAGLNVILKIVAVYVVPYPAELRWPAAMEQHLTLRLAELAEHTNLPVRTQIVLSRDRSEGFRQVLRPGSAVLLGSSRRFWRTREEKLARSLTRQGHQVSLIRFD